MITLLNNPILIDHREYEYAPIPALVAKTLVELNNKFDNIRSGMAPAYTSHILNRVLNANIPEDKIEYSDELGEIVLIAKLIDYPEKDTLLAMLAAEETEFIFWLLTKIK